MSGRSEIGMLVKAILVSVLVALSAIISLPVAAADRIGFRPGTDADDAYESLRNRCPDSDVGPPDITCVRGGFILTATTTKKGRIFWLRLMETSTEDPLLYAQKLAAELSMSGELKPCHEFHAGAYCVTDDDGTVLAAGSTEYEGFRTSYFLNERFLQQDGGQQ